MGRLEIKEAFRALRLRGALFFCLVVAAVLLLLGQKGAAAGVLLGFALFAVNGFLLAETGRALLDMERSPKAAVAVSAIGRLLMIGLGLAAIFLLIGRPAGLGACGGVLLSQVHLVLANRLRGLRSDA